MKPEAPFGSSPTKLQQAFLAGTNFESPHEAIQAGSRSLSEWLDVINEHNETSQAAWAEKNGAAQRGRRGGRLPLGKIRVIRFLEQHGGTAFMHVVASELLPYQTHIYTYMIIQSLVQDGTVCRHGTQRRRIQLILTPSGQAWLNNLNRENAGRWLR